MGVLAPVLLIELAVIAGSHYALGFKRTHMYALQGLAGSLVPVNRAVNTNSPVAPGRIVPLAENLPYVHQHVRDPYAVQVIRHHVTAVTLGYRVEIQLAAIGGDCLRDPLRLRERIPREPEAPHVEQRRRPHVERSSGLLLQRLRQRQYVPEHWRKADVLPRVVAAQDGIPIVSGKGVIYHQQYGIYGGLYDRGRGLYPLEVQLDGICTALSIPAHGNISVPGTGQAQECRNQEKEPPFHVAVVKYLYKVSGISI